MIYSNAAKPASAAATGFVAFEWPWIALTLAGIVVAGAITVRLISKARGNR